MTGIAVAVLGVGLYGVNQPLLPPEEPFTLQLDSGENVFVEEFNPPAAASSAEELIAPEIESHEEIEIPPLPPIEIPLTPPEMAELIPLAAIPETAQPQVSRDRPDPAVKPRTSTKRSTSMSNPDGPQAGSGPSVSATLFSGGGGDGRFPSPSYPALARSSGLQGTVQLLVIVESNGTPGSVSIQSTSGHTSLDKAASDHVRRRWHWPAGDVRRYIVPIRFVLQ